MTGKTECLVVPNYPFIYIKSSYLKTGVRVKDFLSLGNLCYHFLQTVSVLTQAVNSHFQKFPFMQP